MGVAPSTDARAAAARVAEAETGKGGSSEAAPSSPLVWPARRLDACHMSLYSRSARATRRSRSWNKPNPPLALSSFRSRRRGGGLWNSGLELPTGRRRASGGLGPSHRSTSRTLPRNPSEILILTRASSFGRSNITRCQSMIRLPFAWRSHARAGVTWSCSDTGEGRGTGGPPRLSGSSCWSRERA